MTIIEADESIQAIHLIPQALIGINHPYCGGAGYLLSGYTAAVMHTMSHSVIRHPIDDVNVDRYVNKAELSLTFD